MKFTNVRNINEFLTTVEKCNGAVNVITKDNKSFNIKDWLYALKILIHTFNQVGIIKEMVIECQYESDMRSIIDCLS